MHQSLLILGASVRAAAWSALHMRCFKLYCIDLFADQDLANNCSAHALAASEYPQGLIEAARLAPPGPWVYTGALENHPKVIDSIARERPLWGNARNVLELVRSPMVVAQALHGASIPCPAIAERLPVDAKKRWLIKRRHSAGGAHIRPWQGQALRRGCFLQERMDGQSCSALYVGRQGDTALFLGATRQLIGTPWLNADGFRYSGNIGPLPLLAETRARLGHLGDLLVRSFGLRGFFGVDFILQDAVPWAVEINPRYTAGLEVLERGYGFSMFALHRDVFEPETGVPPKALPREPASVHGKAILYAKAPLVFPSRGPWQSACSWNSLAFPEFADVPHAKSQINARQPIMTLFAHAPSEADCLELLRKKAQALDRRLFG